MLSKAGLIGLYQASNIRNKLSSVYMISDEDTASLYVFILFPGSYHDVYEIASLTAYNNVFIVPISLDPAYMSDIYRLVNELIPIKTVVKIISPAKYAYSNCNIAFLNSFVKGSAKSSYVYSGHGFISFNWNDDEPKYPDRLNDIYCTFDNRRILLTSVKVDKERIIRLFENDQLDYVYVPWSKNPEYNSTYTDNFISLMECEQLEPYKSKIIPYGFNDSVEIKLCQEKYPNNFPVTIRHLFINTTMESSMENAITWADVNMKPHKKPVDPFSYNSCNRIPPKPPYPYGPHGPHDPHRHPFDPHWNIPKDGCKNCPFYNPPKTEETFDVTDVAISILDEYCPNFKVFATSCSNTCDECKLKTYFGLINTDDPDTGDINNPDSNTDSDSGSTEEPVTPPETSGDNESSESDPTAPDSGDENTEQGSQNTTEDGSDSGTENTGNTAEETADITEQSASERLFS